MRAVSVVAFLENDLFSNNLMVVRRKISNLEFVVLFFLFFKTLRCATALAGLCGPRCVYDGWIDIGEIWIGLMIMIMILMK